MRGIPNNPVECMACGEKKARPKTGLCPRCQLKQNMDRVKPPKYRWTPELQTLLRGAYAEGKDRKTLAKGISEVVRRSGFPRHIVSHEAQRLGICGHRWKFWRAEETELLRERAGDWSPAKIARALKRGVASVKVKASALGIPLRLTSTYSRREVGALLGVSHSAVERWIARGWLRVRQYGDHVDRIGETAVGKFLKQHPEEYDLRRVDQAWFKGMLFPGYGVQRQRAEAAD